MLMHLDNYLFFFFIYLQLQFSVNYSADATVTSFSYKYYTNISLGDTAILQEFEADVFLSYIVASTDGSSDASPFHKRKLTYYNVSLHSKSDSQTSSSYIEAVSIHDTSDGLVKQVFLDSTASISTSQLNLLKGLISLTTIHSQQSVDHEIDSSGRCWTLYALVDESGSASDLSIIDRIKTECKSLQQPLDQWNYNEIHDPITSHHRFIQSRYQIEKSTGHLVRVDNFENHNLSLFSWSGIVNSPLELIGWQHLKLIKPVGGDMKLPFDVGKSSDLRQLSDEEKVDRLPVIDSHFLWGYVQENFLCTTSTLGGGWLQAIFDRAGIVNRVTKVFGRSIHLQLLFPIEEPHQAASLNFNLHNKVDQQQPDTLSAQQTEFTRIWQSRLRDLFESVRDFLHPNRFTTLQSVHQINQLVRLLRQLPSTDEDDQWIDVLGQASRLVPPAIQPDRFYRQADSWYDQLTDVLIACGTRTCLEVVVRRVEAFTKSLTLSESKRLKLEQQQLDGTRRILVNRLWPALSHVQQPAEFLNRLIDSCQALEDVDDDRLVCWTTLSNLCGRSDISPAVVMCRAEVKSLTRKLLTFPTNNGGLEASNRTALITGIKLAERVWGVEFVDQLLKIVQSDIPNTALIRASAIRTLVKIFTLHKHSSEMNKVVNLSIEITALLKAFPSDQDSTDQVIVGRELFIALLQMEVTIDELAILLRDMGEQKRAWSLVKSCRLLLLHWCKTDRLSRSECCIFNFDASNCDQVDRGWRMGLAGGWSGLAANSSRGGQTILIDGSLVNADELVTDWTLTAITGPSGEIRMSDFDVTASSEQSERQLFKFIILADGLASLGSNWGIGRTNSKVDDTLWINLGLDYLQTQTKPWTILSGGLTDLISAMWNVPTQPTSLLQVIKPIIDQRSHITFSSGWIVQIDLLATLAVEINAKLQTSYWHQTGKTSVSTKNAFAFEVVIRALQGADSPVQSSIVNTGICGQSTLNFLTDVYVTKLPEGICMKMELTSPTSFRHWTRHDSFLQDPTLQPAIHLNRYDLDNTINNIGPIFSLELPGISFNLGTNNSRRCTQLI